jgi:hypothetical protein
MSELNILNPARGYDADLGFNPNWSYGSKTKVGENMSYAQARRGASIARETGTMGYTFDMVFAECTWAKIQWLKNFYQQYKTGYFTINDFDGGGRQHVGRFITAPEIPHARNLIYSTQMVFESVQGARMINYPSDWVNDSYFIYALADDLSQRVNTGNAAVLGFLPQQTPAAVLAGTSPNDPSSYEMYCDDHIGGSFAQVEYSGWGFQMNFRLAPNNGIVDIYLDGSLCISQLDLYNGENMATMIAGTSVGIFNPDGSIARFGAAGVGYVLVTVTNLPLDAHRVKVISTATKNPASTSYGAIYPALQVMY